MIKVFEKQKVEIFDSLYFLSLYNTKKSFLAFIVDNKQVHFKSHEPDNSDGESIQFGPYKNVAPVSFE